MIALNYEREHFREERRNLHKELSSEDTVSHSKIYKCIYERQVHRLYLTSKQINNVQKIMISKTSYMDNKLARHS